MSASPTARITPVRRVRRSLRAAPGGMLADGATPGRLRVTGCGRMATEGPRTTPSGWLGRPSHIAWLTDEAARLLEFARGARVERGFGWLGPDGTPDPERPLQLWITTRMTHVFALGDLIGHPGCAPLVDHGLASIRVAFEDAEHGGWFPEVGADGRVRTDKEA